ncbi:MAG: hypothetical protein ACK6C7_09730 [Pseudanabaena sp.]
MNETSGHSEGESVWKRLRHGNIATCEEALNFLVDIEAILRTKLASDIAVRSKFVEIRVRFNQGKV